MSACASPYPFTEGRGEEMGQRQKGEELSQVRVVGGAKRQGRCHLEESEPAGGGRAGSESSKRRRRRKQQVGRWRRARGIVGSRR